MEKNETAEESLVPEEETDEATESRFSGPVFVVGNGRSGTSIMLSTVRKTLGWKYHGEGHVYPLLHELLLGVDRYFKSKRVKNLQKNQGHMVTHVKPSQVKNQMPAMFRVVFDGVYGTTEFVDKTPGPNAMLSLPFLYRAFPDMRVIHMKRRGIEVVRSAERKFPDASFETHVKAWAKAINNWEKVEPRLVCPHITIDQYELATNPEDVSRRLGDFLSLTDDQEEAMLGYFQNDRPQSSGSLNLGGVSLEDTGWDDDKIATFRAIGDDIMKRHGWSETEAYFAD